jgi:hypothetical protein
MLGVRDERDQSGLDQVVARQHGVISRRQALPHLAGRHY